MYTVTNRFYRSPEGDGGGFSLADLNADDSAEPVLTAEELAAKAAAQDGLAGVPKVTDLADAAAQQQADGGNQPNKPADAGDAAAKVETPEEIAAREAQEAEDAATAAAAGGDDPGDDEDFYSVVDTLRGDELSTKITYPEGVDPTSPEGVVIREKFIEELGAINFEEELKKNDPRGYAYLLHRQNGGDDDTFFAKQSYALPDLDAVEDSVDLQRQVYTQSLLSKGNSPKQAAALVELAIKEGELSAEAKAAYTEMKDREAKEFEEINKKTEERNRKQKDDITSFGTMVATEIEKGENLKFVIPEADKPKFLQAVKDNIMYENGQFYIVKPVNKENLSETLQTELFGYLKGDLKKLIERQAKTLQAKKLSLQASSKNAPKNTHVPAQGQTLGEI